MNPANANKIRFEHVDFLRAIAIVGMIVTHALSYNLGTDRINTLWNYLHFVVPLFIFCSGYVMYSQYKSIRWSWSTVLPWYKRRITRLLIPYYAFTLLHYALWLVIPAYISGLGLSKAPQFLSASLLLVGVDYGWLPILFLELMLVTPLYLIMMKIRWIRVVVPLCLAASTLLLLFIRSIGIDYRFYMWIPWSTILLLSFAAAKNDEGKLRKPIIFTMIGASAFAIFAFEYWILSSLHLPLTLTLHKYPPDIFYLSYGVGMGCLLLLIERLDIFHANWFKQAMQWISSHSYELFFVHYIVIDLLQTYQKLHRLHIPIVLQLIISLMGSIAVIYGWEQGRKRINSVTVKRLIAFLQ